MPSPSPASAGDVPLLDDSWSAGAAFYLGRPSRKSLIFDFDGGWRIQVIQGSQICVIRGCGLQDYLPVYKSCLHAVRVGLDLMCVLGKGTFALNEAVDEHIVFWPRRDGDGLAITWNGTIRDSIHARVGDTTEPPVLPHHPSLAHFRRSETETDIADSFRHAYLALEALLDSIYPQASSGLGESDWLAAALQAAQLHSRLPDLPGAKPGEKPWDTALRRWYNDERLRFFHSKPSRHAPIHLSPDEYEAILDKKGQVLSYFLSLALATLGSNDGYSYMSLHALDAIVDAWYAASHHFIASDDQQPVGTGTAARARPGLRSIAPSGDGYIFGSRIPPPTSHRIKRVSLNGEDGHETAWLEYAHGTICIGESDTFTARIRLKPSAWTFQSQFLS